MGLLQDVWSMLTPDTFFSSYKFEATATKLYVQLQESVVKSGLYLYSVCLLNLEMKRRQLFCLCVNTPLTQLITIEKLLHSCR